MLGEQYLRDLKEKQMQDEQKQQKYWDGGAGFANQAAQATCQQQDTYSNRRQTLLDRVTNQRNVAEQQSAKASRLAELQYLLEAHPETARILDLLSEAEIWS